MHTRGSGNSLGLTGPLILETERCLSSASISSLACSSLQGSDEGELTFRIMGSGDGPALRRDQAQASDNAGARSPPSPPIRDTDAKNSALKALAGIGKVVSKSRRTDAEALLAIKAQRAKSRVDGGGHRHSRTMSSESLPPVSELSTTSTHLPAPNRGHRRSHSSIQMPSQSAGIVASVPLTSPFAYADWLSGRSLAELLALQTAVKLEIEKQVGSTGGSQASTSHFPTAETSAAPPSHYASALLAAAEQQQQQNQHHAAALHQALASASGTMCGADSSGQGHTNSYRTTGGTPPTFGGPMPPRSPQKPTYSHAGLLDGLRNPQQHAHSTSPPPYSEHTPFSGAAAAAAAANAAGSLSLSRLDPITPSPVCVTAPLDVGSLVSPSNAAGSRHSLNSSYSNTPEFSFLNDGSFTSADLPLPSFICQQHVPAAPSPFGRVAGLSQLPPRPRSTSTATSTGGDFYGKPLASQQQQQQPGELPSLFSSMQLGQISGTSTLNPWL